MTKCLLTLITGIAFLATGTAMAQDPETVTLRASVYDFIGDSEYTTWDLGVYTFMADPNESNSFTAQAKSHMMYSNSGAVFTNEYFYSFFSRTDDFDDQQKGVIVRKYDINDNYNLVSTEQYDTISGLETYDMAYCPADKKYYGVFKKITQVEDEDDTDEQRLGYIDLETMAITYITQEPLPYMVYTLAADSNGDLYGIAPLYAADEYSTADALVKFDKQTGLYEVVGLTGTRTQYRHQSATIDQRTNKMYWVGYVCTERDAEGKKNRDWNVMALYEVDLATGAATKIYDMPTKLQLAGLHVVENDNGDALTGINDVKVTTAADITGPVSIYSVDGRLMYRGNRDNAQLSSGIYIVSDGTRATRIAIK